MSYRVSIHGVTDEAVCVQGLSPLSKCLECNSFGRSYLIKSIPVSNSTKANSICVICYSVVLLSDITSCKT